MKRAHENSRYDECHRCGERYWGADIDRHLKADRRGNSVCCNK